MLKLSRRHIAKTLTWRLTGTLDTLVISWFITGRIDTGIKIGIAELITKMLLYYAHERIWFLTKKFKSHQRHLIKTFTWRFVGTVDTIFLAWLFTGNPITGLKIGTVEVITKMILYYAHEKIWYKINFGIRKRDSLISNNKEDIQ